MWRAYNAIAGTIHPCLMHSIHLRNFINQNPGLRYEFPVARRNIWADGVIQWHELGDGYNICSSRRGRLRGWKYYNGKHHGVEIYLPQIRSLAFRDEIDFKCDIGEVSGIQAARSKPSIGTESNYYDLDELVEKDTPWLISEITEEKLRENLSYERVDIVNKRNGTDFFVMYKWDGRVFLMNSDGAHHFSAARYIADRLNKSVQLEGKLVIHHLNPSAVAELRHQFDLFALSNKSCLMVDFREIMENFGATYYWMYLPRPLNLDKELYDDDMVVLMPKNELQSRRASRILRQSGFIDFGCFLLSMV